MKKTGMMEWWKHGLVGLLMSCCVRFADDPGGGGGDPGGAPAGGGDPGGGGDSWFSGVEGLPEGAAETLGGFGSQAEALSALHSSSRPLADRIIELDPELEGSREKLKEFDNPAKLAKSYISLQKKLGSNPLVAPGENASDEERTAFNEQINTLRGVPESADGYQFDISEELSAVGVTDELVGGFKSFARENGMNQTQFESALNYYADQERTVVEQFQQEQVQEAQAINDKLSEEWGGQSTGNLKLIQRVLEKAGLGAEADPVDRAVNYNKLLLNLAQSMEEGGAPFQVASAGSLKQQLSTLKKDPAYLDSKKRIGDKANIISQVNELQRQIAEAG